MIAGPKKGARYHITFLRGHLTGVAAFILAWLYGGGKW